MRPRIALLISLIAEIFSEHYDAFMTPSGNSVALLPDGSPGLRRRDHPERAEHLLRGGQRAVPEEEMHVRVGWGGEGSQIMILTICICM